MHKAVLPCSTFRGMNWDRQRHEKDGLRFVELKLYGSQHYIFRCHDMPHLHNIEVLKTEIIKCTAYKFGAIQTSIFYYKMCFCPQKFSNSFLPDMRRLAPRKASTKKKKKKVSHLIIWLHHPQILQHYMKQMSFSTSTLSATLPDEC